MELIDKEALIETLKEPIDMDAEKTERLWEGWHECTIYVDEAINKQPVIEIPYWTPCYNKLPKLNKYVFASVKSGEQEWIEKVALKKKHMSDSFYWDVANGKTLEFHKVLAWMEMPKLYKGENDG